MLEPNLLQPFTPEKPTKMASQGVYRYSTMYQILCAKLSPTSDLIKPQGKQSLDTLQEAARIRNF